MAGSFLERRDKVHAWFFLLTNALFPEQGASWQAEEGAKLRSREVQKAQSVKEGTVYS